MSYFSWQNHNFTLCCDTMLYYKFLNDEKGELSQLWIASQSPNKVSKRVILDISISVFITHLIFYCIAYCIEM